MSIFKYIKIPIDMIMLAFQPNEDDKYLIKVDKKKAETVQQKKTARNLAMDISLLEAGLLMPPQAGKSHLVFAEDAVSCIENTDIESGRDRRARYAAQHNAMHLPFKNTK